MTVSHTTADAASRTSFSFTAGHFFFSFFFPDSSLFCSFYLCCCKIRTAAAQHISITNHYSQGKWITKVKKNIRIILQLFFLKQ